jgi:hypothetical protein
LPTLVKLPLPPITPILPTPIYHLPITEASVPSLGDAVASDRYRIGRSARSVVRRKSNESSSFVLTVIITASFVIGSHWLTSSVLASGVIDDFLSRASSKHSKNPTPKINAPAVISLPPRHLIRGCDCW